MDIHISQKEAQANITLSGDFTFDSTMDFKRVLALTEEPSIKLLVVDFQYVTFVDSAALGMLMVLRSRAVEKEQQVALCYARGQVEKIFRLSRFDTLFSIIP